MRKKIIYSAVLLLFSFASANAGISVTANTGVSPYTGIWGANAEIGIYNLGLIIGYGYPGKENPMLSLGAKLYTHDTETGLYIGYAHCYYTPDNRPGLYASTVTTGVNWVLSEPGFITFRACTGGGAAYFYKETSYAESWVFVIDLTIGASLNF